jgi:hypothetical protein
MKQLLLALFLFLWVQGIASSIIFVHLGPSVPSCILTTMKQARHLNPDSTIYLLSDQKAHQVFQSQYKIILEEEKVVLVNMEEVPKTSEHWQFYRVNKLSPSFVEGYWMFASERFFVLYDFIKDQKLTDVLHLESDCMLYLQMEEILPLFTNTGLAAPFQSLRGCIPCFVFIKDALSLAPLIEHMLLEMENFEGIKPHLSINDMQTLASFYRKFGPNALLPLPTLMPEYAKKHPKRRSSFVADNATPLLFLSLYANRFPEYLFDAASLGIFINGNDRKYSPHHGPGTVHARCLFNPHFFSFFWGENAKGHNVPYLSFQGKHYRIANLHFHSKMPEEYGSFRPILGRLPSKSNL